MKQITLFYQRQIIFKKEYIMGKIKEIYKKIDDWSRQNVFLSGVAASITASIMLGIVGYFFALKPLNDQVSRIIIALNQTTTMDDNNGIINNGDKNNNNNKNGNNINNNGTINYYYNKSDSIDPDFISNAMSIFDENQTSQTTTISIPYRCYQPINASNTLVHTETGENYSYDNFANTTIAFNYTENGQDIFFKGQYDKQGYWDGNCVMNYYLDGKLIVIMDAEYNSGTLKSYKRIFTHTKKYNNKEYEVWAIAYREIEDNLSIGETWTYFKYDDYLQEFNTDNVLESDILNEEDFKSKLELFLEGYYSGYTSDNYYNDTTGEAYLIKYFEPGIIKSENNKPVIRMLYKGNFINGQPEDNSYNAWSIARESDTTYMYYKGSFSNGSARPMGGIKEVFTNYLTHKQIDEYLDQYGFSEYSEQFITEYEN